MTDAHADTSGQRSSGRWPSPPPGRPTLVLLGFALVGLGAGLALSRPDVPPLLTAVAGAVLALGLPGAALTQALFPGVGMGRAERVTLAIGLQSALVVLSGFLLHLLPPGLSSASWGALLADVTLLACAVAWVRSRRARPQRISRAAAESRGWLATFSSASTRQLALLIGAGLLATLSLGVARAGVVAQPQPAWTALAITAAADRGSVTVSVANAEGHPETYRLVATIDGEPLATVEGLTLADGASATQTIELAPAGAFLRAVDVGLWRAADPPDGEPYRAVRLSLRGGSAP